jgi:benzoylformate decarboxylase
MPSVRDVSFDLLREHGMTTMFGNPGSTELPMLGDFPDDFTYVLGLQEAVAVGMADGYAQASGTVGHVNLHTAPGVGNGMGAIFNAWANKTPLLVTAGQQARSLVTLQANLTNKDATQQLHPWVKWTYEPPRAQDVPAALARGIHLASSAPGGPTFVSVPMDDWDAEAEAPEAEHLLARRVSGRPAPDATTLRALADRIDAAKRPVLVAGPELDGHQAAAAALAEKARMTVWAIPAPGGGKLGFPENHDQFQGILPPAIGPLSQTLDGHDLIVVAGSSVFPYYPNIPGPLLPEGAALVSITSDPDEAARAPMGEAIVGDPGAAITALAELVAASDREPPPVRPAPNEPEAASPMTGSAAMQALADAIPDDAIVVLEAPSATIALRNRLRLHRPGSYYFGAGGGLGFGLSAALGVQRAQPNRPVVCVLGEGSAQYAITALWTAAAYDVPLTILVLRNEEYAILKWFSALEQVTGAPALDLPRLNCTAIAEAYGVPAQRAEEPDALVAALRSAIGHGPRLIEAPVGPGMWLE